MLEEKNCEKCLFRPYCYSFERLRKYKDKLEKSHSSLLTKLKMYQMHKLSPI